MGWGAHGNHVFRNLHGVSPLEPALWRARVTAPLCAVASAAPISATRIINASLEFRAHEIAQLAGLLRVDRDTALIAR